MASVTAGPSTNDVENCKDCTGEKPSFASLLEQAGEADASAPASQPETGEMAEQMPTDPSTSPVSLASLSTVAMMEMATDTSAATKALTIPPELAGNDNDPSGAKNGLPDLTPASPLLSAGADKGDTAGDKAGPAGLIDALNAGTSPASGTGADTPTPTGHPANSTPAASLPSAPAEAPATPSLSPDGALIAQAGAKGSKSDLAGLTKETGADPAARQAGDGRDTHAAPRMAKPPRDGAKATNAETAATTGQAATDAATARSVANSGKTANLNLPEAKPELTGQKTNPSGETAPPAASGSQSSGSEEKNRRRQQGDKPSPSLMDRLKPLQQQAGAPFRFQDNEALDGFKTADPASALLTTGTAGDITRPAGTGGLAQTQGNPGTPTVPLNNIAVHIAAQARAGNQHFNIRLDPPELGRIDIRLEIGRDGQTLTHLAVDKPETLDLLRQDSRALERALTNAGLDSRNGSLSFSLRDDQSGRQQHADRSGQNGDHWSGNANREDNETGPMEEPVTERRLNISSGIDISI